MSVLFIKIGLVSIGAEQDVRHPVRRSAHLLTDHIQVNIRAAFDDQLIMNVTDDEAVLESFHGVAEDVAADGLDDVLHELWTVGFDVNLLNCGYIQAYDRGGDIILTEKGRSVETGLYPTENDLQMQREYWDKKNRERYFVMNTGS